MTTKSNCSFPNHDQKVSFDLASRAGDAWEICRDIHHGQTAIVCGLGPSIAALPDDLPPDVTTLSVNDIERYRKVDYMLMIDQPIVFKRPRIETIVKSSPRMWFMGTVSHASWNAERQRCGMSPLSPVMNIDSGLLPGKRLTTPSLAIGLALYLGFKRIGVIGVDISTHPTLRRHLDAVNCIFTEVLSAAFLAKAGLVNLSPKNNIPVLPQMSIRDFLDGADVSHSPRRQRAFTQFVRYCEKGSYPTPEDPRIEEINTALERGVV